MNCQEAKELLSYHSCRSDDISNPKWRNGFLGQLRPFRGILQEENFIVIMECLKQLQEHFSMPMLARELVSDVITIIHLAVAWAGPDGMLGANHLLSQQQETQLQEWIMIIGTCLFYLLDGAEEEAFADYERYLEDRKNKS